MATTPIIIFNDSTDYDSVLLTTKRLFARLVATKDGCGCDGDLNHKLCKVLTYITAAEINKADLDQITYEEAVESAYLAIDCNC